MTGGGAGTMQDAAAYALAHECDWPRSMFLPDGRYIGTAAIGDRPPHDVPLGPVRPRGGVAGLILRGGEVLAEWGDTARADMTFSVAKSYLGVLAGIALADRLIRDVDDPVRDYAQDDGFASPHNAGITWRHLLQQTSEWQGTLWGLPDSVDHNRQVGPEVDRSRDTAAKGVARALQPPGTRWEYNDVRVNRLALSLLQVFRRPLPEVLRERVMDPVGASGTWEWRGYRSSMTEIGGRQVESVSGGGHWGGGLFISARDHALFGRLVLQGGRWNGRTVLPEGATRLLAESCPLNPLYGGMWWLNTGAAACPSAPESSLFARGAGGHVIWLDPVHDLVMVVRWLDREHLDPLIGRVLAAL